MIKSPPVAFHKRSLSKHFSSWSFCRDSSAWSLLREASVEASLECIVISSIEFITNSRNDFALVTTFFARLTRKLAFFSVELSLSIFLWDINLKLSLLVRREVGVGRERVDCAKEEGEGETRSVWGIRAWR